MTPINITHNHKDTTPPTMPPQELINIQIHILPEVPHTNSRDPPMPPRGVYLCQGA